MDILAPCWYFRFLGLNKFQYSAYVIFCAGHPWIVDDRISLDKPLDSAILSHLKQFSETNKLKKMDLHMRLFMLIEYRCTWTNLLTHVIAERLSEEEMGGWKGLFKMIDTDNSETIILMN